ncbi:MAG: PorT family protein [Bacteroidetes bacterium]|nr:MAG: PorT family protein [Bacteroidota bacterium]
MKKLILLVAIALIGFNVTAQGVDFGVKAGANFANIGGDETDDYGSRTSFHFGVTAGIAVSDNFSVQPELVYSSQGATFDFEGIDGDVQLNYLNLPIMAQFQVADGFSVEVGPQFGFLMSANLKVDDEEEDIKDELKGLDLAAGIGVNYAMASGLNFGARYNLGLSNVNDGDDDIKNQNNVIQVSIGYRFGGGSKD